MRKGMTLYFDTLARDLAVTVGAAVRRWWLDPAHPQCFHVEAVRTFVGAKPVVVQFTATLAIVRPPQLRGQPRMQVVTAAPLPAAARRAPDSTSPSMPRRPRPSRRPRVGGVRARAGAQRTATPRPQTATTRPRRTRRLRSRPRARR